jgi:hypothetical protein
MALPDQNDKLRRAADNALLILVSRWATVVLVPISLTFGMWLITTVQQLVLDVQDIRTKQVASIELFNTRYDNMDRRVGRLEGIEDRRVYGQQPKQ